VEALANVTGIVVLPPLRELARDEDQAVCAAAVEALASFPGLRFCRCCANWPSERKDELNFSFLYLTKRGCRS
jgi:hypothetical protein